jgi:exopolyphosphatase/guanosine-5'-triphosphate,3'-diphosphate pyrophosphatase
MRLGILDVGSNSVKLQVVDGYPGAPPLPMFASRARLRLAESLDEHGAISPPGVRALVAAVSHAVDVAHDHDVTELIAFATEAIRRAANSTSVREALREEADVAIQQLSGEDEARLTFLAARRWFGWSAGRMLLLDIGGGSLEIAYGRDEEPSLAVSLPLGAGELTRSHLPDDPPKSKHLRELRRHVKRTIGEVGDRLRWEGVPRCVVGTSKTFKQLARLSGAPGQRKGPFVERTIDFADVQHCVERLSSMGERQRAAQPGVSQSRARQILAGAVVAEIAMRTLDVQQISVCPWAVREGVVLRRLDRVDAPGGHHDDALIASATVS